MVFEMPVFIEGRAFKGDWRTSGEGPEFVFIDYVDRPSGMKKTLVFKRVKGDV